MRVSTMAQLGFVVVAGVLTACDNGKCQAVLYSDDGVDTMAIAKTGGDCTAYVFKADSVLPKPPR